MNSYRAGTLEVPQRRSPATPRTARKLKTCGSDADPVSSPNMANKTPKSSPKVTDRRSPRSPISEVFMITMIALDFILLAACPMLFVVLIISLANDSYLNLSCRRSTRTEFLNWNHS